MKINKFIISVTIAFVILSIQFIEVVYAQATVKGDLNNDGKVDVIDLGIPDTVPRKVMVIIFLIWELLI